MWLLLFGFVALGCAAPPGGGEVHFSGTAPSGTSAQVEVDATSLMAERRTAFLSHGGAERVGTAVLQELSNAGKGDAETTVRVQITRFRLRSGSSAFWLGAMAGADIIACSVEVLQAGTVTKQFETDTSTIMGGLIMPGPVTRFNRLVAELARRIAAKV
jgi:hypothetical protein